MNSKIIVGINSIALLLGLLSKKKLLAVYLEEKIVNFLIKELLTLKI